MLLVQSVRNARKVPGDPGFRAVMTRAVTEVWGRPVELAGAALTLVRTDQAIRNAIRQINEVWPRRIAPSILAPAMPALTQDPLLHRVMETAPVRDEGLERLLASTRTVLLDAALDPSSDIAPEMLPFCCALARQCFINEYVFHLPDVEHDGMVALRGKLMSDLSGTTPVHAIALLAYACYAPLATLDRAAAISRREWPQPVRDVIDQQVDEPEQEARHRAADAAPLRHHRRDVGARTPAIRGEPLSALGAASADATRARHRGLPACRVSARAGNRHRGAGRRRGS